VPVLLEARSRRDPWLRLRPGCIQPRLAAIVEGAWQLHVEGKVASDYSRNLEFDVPALLQEAAVLVEDAAR
jgi:hypothetical protein